MRKPFKEKESKYLILLKCLYMPKNNKESNTITSYVPLINILKNN